MENQLTFNNRMEFREWLKNNHSSNKGIWLVFGKVKSVVTVKAGEALEEALCFGWIDGQMKSIDETIYIKKFTPRRKNSVWSERNKTIVEKLIHQGDMMEAGYAAIEQAKKSGIWDMPKPEPVSEVQIAVLADALKGTEPAYTNFLTMPLSSKKQFTMHYITAKADETKRKRLEQIISKLNENKRLM